MEKQPTQDQLDFISKISRNVCEKTVGEMDFQNDDITWNGIQIEFKNKEERHEVRRALACYIEFFLQNDIEGSGKFDIMFCAKKVDEYDHSAKAETLRIMRAISFKHRFEKGLNNKHNQPDEPLKVNIVDVIKSRIDIVKTSGNKYLALCPFHEEKTPSFTVNQDKQFYHCFGCGAHGDYKDFIINFKHRAEGKSFNSRPKNKTMITEDDKDEQIMNLKEQLNKVIQLLSKDL